MALFRTAEHALMSQGASLKAVQLPILFKCSGRLAAVHSPAKIKFDSPSRGRRCISLAAKADNRTSTKTTVYTAAETPPQIKHIPLDNALSRAVVVTKSHIALTENEVKESLAICEDLAKDVESSVRKISTRDTSVDELLSLDSKRARRFKAASDLNHAADKISSAAYSIVKAPQTFITPRNLASYVKIQTTLRRPQSLPEVFDLYATKPIPQRNTAPIGYTNARPNAISAAIPLDVARAALQCAIDIRDLPSCLGIIDTTISTTAYKRAKLLRRAALPVSALSLSPLAAYGLASQLERFQTVVEPQMITWMGTVGIVAYIGFTSMLGLVAITTANDQMERITWITGTPLVERWVREDERALTDQVAISWGFSDRQKRGDEEGPDWHNLREWALARGMILDKPELLEGME